MIGTELGHYHILKKIGQGDLKTKGEIKDTVAQRTYTDELEISFFDKDLQEGRRIVIDPDYVVRRYWYRRVQEMEHAAAASCLWRPNR